MSSLSKHPQSVHDWIDRLEEAGNEVGRIPVKVDFEKLADLLTELKTLRAAKRRKK